MGDIISYTFDIVTLYLEIFRWGGKPWPLLLETWAIAWYKMSLWIGILSDKFIMAPFVAICPRSSFMLRAVKILWIYGVVEPRNTLNHVRVKLIKHRWNGLEGTTLHLDVVSHLHSQWIHSTFQQIYSRVVRICKRDHGGGGPFFSNNFVTYLKARIYCSYTRAGQSPYDFNEIGNSCLPILSFIPFHLYDNFIISYHTQWWMILTIFVMNVSSSQSL